MLHCDFALVARQPGTQAASTIIALPPYVFRYRLERWLDRRAVASSSETRRIMVIQRVTPVRSPLIVVSRFSVSYHGEVFRRSRVGRETGDSRYLLQVGNGTSAARAKTWIEYAVRRLDERQRKDIR